jgi:methylamine dehydrogenase accessory protein MauD
VVAAIAHQEKSWLRVVFASDGNEPDHQAVIKSFGLEDFDYVLSTEVGMSYQVAKLPYSYLLDVDGEVAAHGLINNREHLESLFEAYNKPTKEDAHAGQMAG